MLVRKKIRPESLLVVLGSGGHTSEMIELMKSSGILNKFKTVEFVVANNDTTSIMRLDSLHTEIHIRKINRIRNVGDSIWRIFVTFPKCIWQSICVIHNVKPNLIIVNGPGTCIPIIFASVILQILFLHKNCRHVFVESFCRTKSVSITGRILYYFVDRFILQWPPTEEIARNFPKAKYLGVLI